MCVSNFNNITMAKHVCLQWDQYNKDLYTHVHDWNNVPINKRQGLTVLYVCGRGSGVKGHLPQRGSHLNEMNRRQAKVSKKKIYVLPVIITLGGMYIQWCNGFAELVKQPTDVNVDKDDATVYFDCSVDREDRPAQCVSDRIDVIISVEQMNPILP